MDHILNFVEQLLNILKTITVVDIIDMLLLAYLIYKGIKLVRETKAQQLITGIFIVVGIYFVSSSLELKVMSFLLQNFFQIGILALVIVFQPELRRILERVGRTNVKSFNVFGEQSHTEDPQHNWARAIDVIGEATDQLSETNTGALIVIERKTRLGDITKTGVSIDAIVSQSLIKNLFFNKAALHDGAVVISENRIAAAGCFLPLTNSKLPSEKGTRHRAGVGMSEASDALVVIVSEETGEISLAKDGKLLGQQNYTTLKNILTDELLGDAQQKKGKKKKTSKKEKVEGENENN